MPIVPPGLYWAVEEGSCRHKRSKYCRFHIATSRSMISNYIKFATSNKNIRKNIQWKRLPRPVRLTFFTKIPSALTWNPYSPEISCIKSWRQSKTSNRSSSPSISRRFSPRTSRCSPNLSCSSNVSFCNYSLLNGL